MREVTVLKGQTLFDIAVQTCGDAALAYDIALMNGIDMFSDLETGTLLGVPDTTVESVTETFSSNKPVSKGICAMSEATKPVSISLTYSELVFMRDYGILEPGRNYRITDYTTTTLQPETASAGHDFDVIVHATSSNTLSEKAEACISDGDTYFSRCRLQAWKIMYCLDNDISRFAWADDINGKGVIYHMCDEFGNEAPYDFKNIVFMPGLFTFSYRGEDLSLKGKYCHDNKIRPYTDGIQILNCNIMDNLAEGECCNNYFESNCHHNYLVDNCHHNTFAAGCYGNRLYLCSNNVFGIGCSNNELADSCNDNHFMNACSNNILGVMCQDNYFSMDCSNNIFGKGAAGNYLEQYCRYITLGSNSSDNRFGVKCSNNILGNNAIGNTFGVGCQNNTMGGDCQYNSFGNYCQNVSFRGRPDLVTTAVDYIQRCHVSDGCSYIVIYTRPMFDRVLQNVNVKRGVVGTATEYIFIGIAEYNSGHEIMVARNTSGEIITYCEADLVE